MTSNEQQILNLLPEIDETENRQWRFLANQAQEKTNYADFDSPLNEACTKAIGNISQIPVVGVYPFVYGDIDSLESNLLWIHSRQTRDLMGNFGIPHEKEFALLYWDLAWKLAQKNRLLCRMVLGLSSFVVNLIASKKFGELKRLVFISEVHQPFEIVGTNRHLYSKNTDPCLHMLEDWISSLNHVASPQKSHRKRLYKQKLQSLGLSSRKTGLLGKKVVSEGNINQMVRFLVALRISPAALNRFLCFVGLDEKEASLRARRELRSLPRQAEMIVPYIPEERQAIGESFRFFFFRALSEEMKPTDVVHAFALAALLAAKAQNVQVTDPYEWGQWVTRIERQFRREWMDWCFIAEHKTENPQRIGY